MPGRSFCRWQFQVSQRLGQLPALANLCIIRDQPGDRRPVLQKNKRLVLVMRTIDAISEIASGFGDADCFNGHRIRMEVFR